MLINNIQLEIYEPRITGDFDEYTGAKKEEYELISTVPADFQNNSANDTQAEQGKKLEDTFKVYVKIDTQVTDRSILRIKGESDTYKLEGSPQKFTNIIPHLRLQLKKHRVKVI